MSSSMVAKARESLPDKAIVATLCKILLCIGIVCYFLSLISSNHSNSFKDYMVLVGKGKRLQSKLSLPVPGADLSSSATNISDLLFGIIGSQGAWNYRKGYVESWWRPNATRGYLYLDFPPAIDHLPWPSSSPAYRVSENLGALIAEINPYDPGVIRMVNAILEIYRENLQGFRWLVMGDDDTIFLVDNLVDVLAKYDHTHYYYIGNPSEYLLSNLWFSFNMAFGGAGFVLSYPLVKSLAENMETCLRRYPHLKTADSITMACIADIGVDLSPHKGFNQIDFHGDLSGFLSSRSKSPLLSLHHFDMVDPIFPAMDRVDATRHLMEAAKIDQSRMLQQTMCYQRQESWTVSVSWGYSVYIYERMFPRSVLKDPIETFQTWMDGDPNYPPHYMFNTRPPSGDPCEAPHLFFFNSVHRNSSTNFAHSIYHRVFPRGMPPCGLPGSHSADNITEIHVYSPARKHNNIGRCECCDVGYEEGSTKVRVTFKDCKLNETIA